MKKTKKRFIPLSEILKDACLIDMIVFSSIMYLE